MITVLGLDGSLLSSPAQERLASAALVVGGRRQLQAVPLPGGVPTAELGRDTASALAVLQECAGDAVVLASGDPGLFGVLRLVRSRLPDAEVEVLPGVSSVALAFARAGLPWDDAVVVSAHGRELAPALAACRAHPKVAVLTSDGRDAAQLASALQGSGRRLFVAERLGLPGERTRWLDGADDGPIDDLNVVLAVDPGRAVGDKGWLAGWSAPTGWALPESTFAHRDGMLTKSEVRAVALARLGPRLGETVWDVGAGSGAVAVECARLGAAVVAVEQGDTAHLRANVAAFGVDVQIVHGRAPQALEGLPDPDAVFVGGGGNDVAAIAAACRARGPRTVVVALATLERLGPVRAALAPYAVDGVLLQASRLRALGDATGLVAANPVLLVWGERP